jgi:large subunit ribosomal protein L18
VDKRKYLDGQRQRRRYRVRNQLRAGTTRPRLSVQRSLKHFACQLVDDQTGRTLASASTRDKAVAGSVKVGGNSAAAAKIGTLIAERAKSAGVTDVALDRGHCKYHGRVKAFADAAREAGLNF